MDALRRQQNVLKFIITKTFLNRPIRSVLKHVGLIIFCKFMDLAFAESIRLQKKKQYFPNTDPMLVK